LEGKADRAGRRFRPARIAGRRRLLQRSEEHTSELQSHLNLVCRLLLAQKSIRGPGRFLCIARFWLLTACTASGAASPGTNGRAPLFFFNDSATTEIYTLSLHDALPI